MILDIRWQDTRVYKEIKEEGVQEGRQEERQEALKRERSFVLRLLTRKVGNLSESTSLKVQQLSFL